MSFGEDLSRFANSTDARADAVVRKIVLDVGVSLVMKSPVGDADYWIMPAPEGYVGGRFRANWQYGLSAPDISTDERIDPSGAGSIGNIVSKTPIKAGGLVHYITNSLPYAGRLEEGWSKRQAPNGMVAITVLEFKPIVEAAARALS
jgi:hypothetical protein